MIRKVQMGKKKSKCVVCGESFECTKDELQELGFTSPPSDAASIHIHIGMPSSWERSRSQFSYWHTICPTCGEGFADAARDNIVLQGLVDLLGWYVRQALDLKKAVDQVRGDIKSFQQGKSTED